MPFSLLWAAGLKVRVTLEREEVVLARMRLGHTYLTHTSSYLLKREERVGYGCPLAVQHSRMDSYNNTTHFFDIRSMKLFDSITPSTILCSNYFGFFYKMQLEDLVTTYNA